MQGADPTPGAGGDDGLAARRCSQDPAPPWPDGARWPKVAFPASLPSSGDAVSADGGFPWPAERFTGTYSSGYTMLATVDVLTITGTGIVDGPGLYTPG